MIVHRCLDASKLVVLGIIEQHSMHPPDASFYWESLSYHILIFFLQLWYNNILVLNPPPTNVFITALYYIKKAKKLHTIISLCDWIVLHVTKNGTSVHVKFPSSLSYYFIEEVLLIKKLMISKYNTWVFIVLFDIGFIF